MSEISIPADSDRLAETEARRRRATEQALDHLEHLSPDRGQLLGILCVTAPQQVLDGIHQLVREAGRA